MFLYKKGRANQAAIIFPGIMKCFKNISNQLSQDNQDTKIPFTYHAIISRIASSLYLKHALNHRNAVWDTHYFAGYQLDIR